MPSDDIVVSVRDLTKVYRIFGHPGDRLKQAMTFGLRRFHREFTALHDVSFDIAKGEAVGVIGQNGSGKSTLLRAICGISKPTIGTIRIAGKISALLELGAGFNPDFTGRENVYFQGALLGLRTEEVDARFDQIAAFADIGAYVEQPVRTYSSGMFVRLAFSVATALAPDILVVDEALSVGDLAFQMKCFSRIRNMIDNGMTLVLVSHSINDIMKHCSRAIFLKHGIVMADGSSEEVANSYLRSIGHSHGNAESQAACIPDDLLKRRSHYYRTAEHRWGLGGASIVDCDVRVDGAPYAGAATVGSLLSVGVVAYFSQDVHRPVYGMILRKPESRFTVGTNSVVAPPFIKPTRRGKGESARYRFDLPLDVGPGQYYLSLGVASDSDDGELLPLDRRYDALELNVVGAMPSRLLSSEAIRFGYSG